MREQVLDFSSSMTARGLLLRGPIGAGKSTIARIVGLLKRVAPLKIADASRILADARFEDHHRIQLRYLPWYVELTLTGLVESLADVQLFGATEGAYTGAVAQRTGVFEQAATGRAEKGREQSNAAKLTGGVVFLDEFGDLPLALQAKLLPVLSGGAFYRVGGEGKSEHELQFRGTVVTASWRRLDTGLIRPDLLSRVSAYTVDIPGLADRMDDFQVLLDGVQDSVIAAITGAIEHAERVEPALDREFWRDRKKTVGRIDKTSRRRLEQVDWSRHGNLRGLSTAIEQMIANGRSADAVLEELPNVSSDEQADSSSGFIERLLRVATPDEGVAGHVRAIEVQFREQLREQLTVDLPLRRQLAQQMKITEQQVLIQARDLTRRRLRASGDPS